MTATLRFSRRHRFRAWPALAGAVLLLAPVDGGAQSLQGSPASLDRQNDQAQRHDFTFLRTPQEVRNFVEMGYLVPVVPNPDFDLHQVSFPYARPEVRVFIERLASQYRSACGEKLVVTSLTRPTSAQPVNASDRSVHPTGMAVDLRRSNSTRCRQWLESTLLSLEDSGVVEATLERNPPHFHVVVFPQPYTQYLAARTESAPLLIQAARSGSAETQRLVTHTVARGETLSGLAGRYNSSVSAIRAENGMRGDRLLVGQQLKIPVSGGEAPPVDEVRVASAAPAANLPERVAPPSAVDATAAPETVHRVARGESLWTIARLYGVSEAELRSANELRGSTILAGQALRVPGEPSTGEGIRYTVQRGDSLWVIATRVGTTVEELRRRNGGSTRIYEGQVLEIPATR